MKGVSKQRTCIYGDEEEFLCPDSGESEQFVATDSSENKSSVILKTEVDMCLIRQGGEETTEKDGSSWAEGTD